MFPIKGLANPLYAARHVCTLSSSFTFTEPASGCHTVPKVIDFPRYNMKCSGENVILRGIVHVVSGFPLHFMFYSGNLDCFSNRVVPWDWSRSVFSKYFSGSYPNRKYSFLSCIKWNNHTLLHTNFIFVVCVLNVFSEFYSFFKKLKKKIFIASFWVQEGSGSGSIEEQIAEPES